MTERIIELLRASGADAWEFTEEEKTGWEFYFISHRLDQNRARLTTHRTVKVYRRSPDGTFLGSAQGELHPTATDSEIEAALRDLLAAASYVRNPAYTLLAPSAAQEAPEAPGDFSLPQIARDFIETMASLPETKTEDINSYEIFADSIRRRFWNSEGVVREAVLPRTMLEVVVNARREGHEIELYRMYHAGTCDREGLRRDLAETMRMGRDKLIAEKTPALGTSDVVFSSAAALELYKWLCDRMDAAAKVRRLSDWELGTPICEPGGGDLLTVTTLRSLPGSSRNTGFDAEGALLRDCDLIRGNVPVTFAGSRQFACRLGLTDSFIPANWRVTGGTAAPEALRTGDFLEAVEFSDFQVDTVTGSIMGELRLGYLHRGGQVTPVSGGSLSGSMRDFIRTLRCSAALRQYDNMLIPAVTRLTGVTVAGS